MNDEVSSPDFGTLPDMVPKRHLYEEPIRVESIEALPPEPQEGGLRVTFWVNLRDSAGQPVRDIAVEGRIIGPERTGQGMANTDEYGQARFRTVGPPGRYRCEIVDVAAGAIDVHETAPPLVAVLETDVDAASETDVDAASETDVDAASETDVDPPA